MVNVCRLVLIPYLSGFLAMGVVCNRGLVDLICCEQYIRATGFGIIRLDEDYSALSCLYGTNFLVVLQF